MGFILLAMLASITKVFTALHVLPEEKLPTGSASGASSASAGQRLTCRRKVPLRRLVPGEEFRDVRPRSNGRSELPGASNERSDHGPNFVQTGFQPSRDSAEIVNLNDSNGIARVKQPRSSIGVLF
jgi:hypothetical protein